MIDHVGRIKVDKVLFQGSGIINGLINQSAILRGEASAGNLRNMNIRFFISPKVLFFQ
jgi:hypothetical protein